MVQGGDLMWFLIVCMVLVGLLVVGCLSVVSLWFMVCLSSLVFVVSFLGLTCC